MVGSGPLNRVSLFLNEIRVSHTLFALPFAYTGAVFAARGIPNAHALVWITIAVLGARTAAMAMNRYLDREIDARNPRTARRAVASGLMRPSAMLWTAAIGALVLLAAAWELNPLCVKLLPIAAVGLAVYPLCKRFTWLTHFVLGAVDGLAPLGAYIGVSGTAGAPAFLLFAAVTIWVGGFDILYALMDLPIDRAQNLRSLPATFGEGAARTLPLLLHAVMAALLAVAGFLQGASPVYYAGVAAALVLIGYEGRLLAKSSDVFALNDAVFNANMLFSVVFLATAVAGFSLR